MLYLSVITINWNVICIRWCLFNKYQLSEFFKVSDKNKINIIGKKYTLLYKKNQETISSDNELDIKLIIDDGGITFGSATLPFILSLGAGIAKVRGGKNSTSDSFGLVGMASIGPILSMIILFL